jgi:hypothetical protein
MIGVVANERELGIVEEFFELFKTPWEPAVRGRKYRVLVGCKERVEGLDADVYVLYASDTGRPSRCGPLMVQFGATSFPIYGGLSTLDEGRDVVLQTTEGSVACRRDPIGTEVWRVGYDLFGEIRHLLTSGQPPSHSGYPTLELHIEVLRHLLRRSSVEFLEIPPSPAGYDFMCCLTHDIDFFGIRRHRLDRTLAGFLARASAGTVRDLIRRRRTLGEALRNLRALLALPFIFIGATRDFWQPFDDYAAVEDLARSTFFLVPFKDRPGTAPNGQVDTTRAVRYDVTEVQREAVAAAQRGSELALHGIDAWRNTQQALEEKRRITDVSNQNRCGVRMHWLYFDEQAPCALDAAGFDYDSTWGYNDAIGYRAGTLQAFRFPGTRNLLELPLAIMDSALFSGGRLALSPAEAVKLYGPMIRDASAFGGTLVINWHDRSLAPERLWGRAYRSLVEKVASRNRVWFTTAQSAVDWYRWRRAITFIDDGSVVRVSATPRQDCAAIIRVHRAGSATPEDMPFAGVPFVTVPMPAFRTQPFSNSIN